jgi:hypothetical protein
MIGQPGSTGVQGNDNRFGGFEIDVPSVFGNDLPCPGFKACFGGALGHSAGDRGHWPDTYKAGSPGHALRDFGGMITQLYRLEGIEKGGVTSNIIIQKTPLMHNFGSDGIEAIAANTKDSFSMSESSIGPFLIHGRYPADRRKGFI